MDRPTTVVISASEIPAERSSGRPVPSWAITVKALIIPSTVPSRPNSGAMPAIVSRIASPFSRARICCRPSSTSSSLISSFGRSLFSSNVRTIFEKGPGMSSQTAMAPPNASGPPISSITRTTSARITFPLLRLQSFARTIHRLRIEQRNSGPIISPPFRITSHIRRSPSDQ